MSTTTVAGVDARAYLAGWLMAVTDMTVKDINAISDELWTTSPGGVARSANHLLADTVTNLIWTTAAMKGETSDCYNNMGALGETFADKNAAIAGLQTAAADFAATLKGASDEALNAEVMAPWQMMTPVMILANISVSHVWYHDGQLNQIQAINGDADVHWM